MSNKNKNNESSPNIVTPEEANKIAPDLPPPGHLRDEELKRRTDELNAAQEKMQDESLAFAVPESALEPNREVQQQLAKNAEATLDAIDFDSPYSSTHIENARDDRHYCWAHMSKRGGEGFQVSYLKRLGFRMIDSKDQEAKNLLSVTGHRQLGDCLLMWCPKDHYKRITDYNQKKQKEVEAATDNQMKATAQKAERAGFTLHTGKEMDDLVARRPRA